MTKTRSTGAGVAAGMRAALKNTSAARPEKKLEKKADGPDKAAGASNSMQVDARNKRSARRRAVSMEASLAAEITSPDRAVASFNSDARTGIGDALVPAPLDAQLTTNDPVSTEVKSDKPLEDAEVARRQVRDVLKAKGIEASDGVVARVAERLGRSDPKDTRVAFPNATRVETGEDGEPTFVYETKVSPARQQEIAQQIADEKLRELYASSDVQSQETKVEDPVVLKRALTEMRDAAKLAGQDAVADTLDTAINAIDAGHPDKATAALAALKSTTGGLKALGGFIEQFISKGGGKTLGTAFSLLKLPVDTASFFNNLITVGGYNIAKGRDATDKEQGEAAFALVEDGISVAEGAVTVANLLATRFGFSQIALGGNPVLTIPVIQARMMYEVLLVSLDAREALHKFSLRERFGTTEPEKLIEKYEDYDWDFDSNSPADEDKLIRQLNTIADAPFRDLHTADTRRRYRDHLDKALQKAGFSPDERALILAGRAQDIAGSARRSHAGIVANRVLGEFVKAERKAVDDGVWNR